VGALLIPAAYFSVRVLTGEQVTASPMKKMNIGAGLLVIAVLAG